MDRNLRQPRPPLSFPDFVPVVLILLAALCFHRQLLFTNQVIMGDDVLLQNLPESKLLYEALESGRLPFWSASTMAGYPLYAEGQAGVFYPPVLFAHKLVRHAVLNRWPLPPGPPWRGAFVLELFFHHAAFAVLLYLLARHLTASPAASVLAATAVSFGGFTISHLIHQNIVRSLPYWPLLWIFAIRGTANKDGGSARDIAFCAVLLALLFLAGHHQTALMIGLSWVAFVAFLERTYAESRAGWAWRTFRRTAFPLVLGIILAGVQLVPTAELWSLSVRNAAASYGERAAWSFTPAHWGSFLIPFVHGTERAANPFFGSGLFHELTGYVGLVPLLVLLIVRPWRDREPLVRFLCGFALVGFGLALGTLSPLYPVHLVPPLSLFRNPCRFLIWVEIGLALAAALTLDDLVEGRAAERVSGFLERFSEVRILTLGLAFALTVYGMFNALGPSVNVVGANGPATKVVLDTRGEFTAENLAIDAKARARKSLANAGVGGAAALAVILSARFAMGQRAAGRLGAGGCAAWLALVGALDVGVFFAPNVWDTKDLAGLLVEPAPIEFLRTKTPLDRYFLEPFPQRRPLAEFVKWRSHGANLYGGSSSIGGYIGPLTPRAWVEFFRRPDAGDPEGRDLALDTLAKIEPVRDLWKLSVAGVGWVLSVLPVPSRDMVPRMTEQDMVLYRNRRALPRLYLARQMRELSVGEDRNAALAALFPKFPAVTIERPGAPTFIAGVVPAPRDALSLTESTPEETFALANIAAPAWMVMTELAYPGWRAFVNDREAETATVCGVFRAVKLPAGISDIRVVFQPEAFRIGAWATLGALGITIVLLGASLFTLEPSEGTEGEVR